ncbi:MAG: STN domain-containing protein [Elusimicrobia bacterium]|nr:STN domain-containing protein [Elusimicrobiota bacterium]
MAEMRGERIRSVGLAAALLCPAADCRSQPPADGSYDVVKATASRTATRAETGSRRGRLRRPAAPRRPEIGREVSLDPMQVRVTVRVKDAPLSVFLELISSQTGLDFVLADGLEKVRVTAFLSDVTARDALELLRLTRGLTYRRVESRGAAVIAPASGAAAELRTKVYTLENVPSAER